MPVLVFGLAFINFTILDINLLISEVNNLIWLKPLQHIRNIIVK